MLKCLKVFVATLLLAGASHAQTDFPTKPIIFVVGFPAGGGMDALARVVAHRASAELGQQIVVENRAGAGGTIAPGFVANARADGYTLYVGETAALVGPVVHETVGYDPLTSFVPIGQMAMAPLVVVANPSIPTTNIKEFIDLVRKNPGKYFYASPGVATIQHLAVEMLKTSADLDIEAAQFQGGAPSVAAVISGEVAFGVVSLNAAIAQAKGGNVKIIGVTSLNRVPGFEQIEAFSEVINGFDAVPRQFLMAPAGTPDAVVNKLSNAIRVTMEDENVRATLSSSGLLPTYVSGEDLAAELPSIVETWSKTAKKVLGKN